MTNPTYENKTSIKDVKSEAQNKLNVDVETPPPPYEAAGGASSTSSNVNYDTKRVDTKNEKSTQIEPIVPIYNNNNLYSNNLPQQQEYFQQNGTTVIYIEGNNNYNVPKDQYHQQQKKRTCIEEYWRPVFNADAWTSLFYFLIIAPVIALFSGIWCLVMFVHAIISLIFPPFGFFFCIGTALSFRALGRLELVAATMCTSKHKPAHMYPPVFRTASHTQGILQYGIKICLDKYTMMCLVYFVFVNLVCTTIAWVLVLTFFVLAFSPLMILFMPVMCRICLKFGIAKVKMSENILIKV